MKKYTWLIPEYFALIKAHFVHTFFPYNPKHWSRGEKGDVVIVQGFNDTPTYLRKIGDRISNMGYRVHTISDLGRQKEPIKIGAEKVAKYIRVNKLQDYFIVSHSKGGLVTKYTLYAHDIPLPRRIFAIAPPFGGSIFGFVPFHNLYEMRRGSHILRELQKSTKYNHLFTTIYPIIDNMIGLPNSSYLEGAENIQVPVRGHTMIMESDAMIQIIVERLI